MVAGRTKLCKGSAECVERMSPYPLNNQRLSSFEDDEGLHDDTGAAGFNRLNALHLRTQGGVRKLG